MYLQGLNDSGDCDWMINRFLNHPEEYLLEPVEPLEVE